MEIRRSAFITPCKYDLLQKSIVHAPVHKAKANNTVGQIAFSIMITLQEHIDALDRMVANGTSVPELRSQVAFIGREVAALEARYVSAVDHNTQLREAQSEFERSFDERILALQERDKEGLRKVFREHSQKMAEIRKRYTLE